MSIQSIIGIVITIIIGVIGVVYTLKQRKKIELTFIINHNIPLFKSIVKNINDLEIKYKGNIIGENLTLLKATIINTGDIDIDKTKIYKPLTISLPEHYNCLEYDLQEFSNGLAIKIDKISNSLVFNWDLLKKNEYFTFNCLLENIDNSNHDKNFVENIQFDHRITNLSSIKTETSLEKPNIISSYAVLFIFLLLISFLIPYFYNRYYKPTYSLYQGVIIDSNLIYVKILAIDNNSIELINTKGEKIKVIDKMNFSKDLTNKYRIIENNRTTWDHFTFWIFTIGFIFMISFIIYIVIKEHKYYKTYKIFFKTYSFKT